MNLKTLAEGAKIAKKLGVKYLPQILTGLGITMMAGATIHAIKVTPEAHETIQQIEEDDELSHKEYVKAKTLALAHFYWPELLMTFGGAGLIIGGQHVSLRRLGVATALLSTERDKVQKLENKIEEKFGNKKLNDIKDEIIQDEAKAKATNLDLSTVYNTGKGNTLIYVMYWGFCLSDMDFIRRATQDCNDDICSNMQRGKEAVVSLNDWLEYINLPPIDGRVNGKRLGPNLGKDLGWRNRSIRLRVTAMMLDNDQTCLAVGFTDEGGPIPDPDISDDYGSDYIDDETDMPWRGR